MEARTSRAMPQPGTVADEELDDIGVVLTCTLSIFSPLSSFPLLDNAASRMVLASVAV